MLRMLNDKAKTVLDHLAEGPVSDWETIATIEPQLGRIIAEAKAIPEPWWTDYSHLKGQLSRLAGWGARNPRLRTAEAYNTAIRELTEALRL